ncbi:hypothetical protein V8E51_003371 [Hyaloscypha variabilis]
MLWKGYCCLFMFRMSCCAESSFFALHWLASVSSLEYGVRLPYCCYYLPQCLSIESQEQCLQHSPYLWPCAEGEEKRL